MRQDQTISRRSVCGTVLSGVAASCLAGIAERSSAADPPQSPSPTPSPKPILRRALGKTGIELPVVSMGCMNTLDGALIKRAFELGVRHFDTAAGYAEGNNERMLGTAIKELGARDQVVVGTKIHIPEARRNMSPADVKAFYLRTAEESLQRLQMDRVDILYHHAVDDVDWLRHPAALEALRQLKDTKKTRFIGFSTHAHSASIAEAARMGFYDVILTSFNVAYWDDKGLSSAMSAAAAAGIGLVAMKTQCSFSNRSGLPAQNRQRLRGQLSQTALLKWALQHPAITTAIPGCTDYAQLGEDFGVAFGLDYTDEEREFLVKRGFQQAAAFCTHCGACLPTCPHGVAIPELMRVHMYARAYGNGEQARSTLAAIPVDRGLARCARCGECRVLCRRAVPVAQRVGDLRSLFA
jgi:predicted aldo/keto reductase-like oxidoreductase